MRALEIFAQCRSTNYTPYKYVSRDDMDEDLCLQLKNDSLSPFDKASIQKAGSSFFLAFMIFPLKNTWQFLKKVMRIFSRLFFDRGSIEFIQL